jgi:hypothetical protein
VRSREGLERKRLRDRARMRALTTVSSYHRDEHSRLYHAETEGSQQARWNRALGEVARRYPMEYQRAFAVELHRCNSQSQATTMGPENECCPAACDDRAAFPNPSEGSEMDERTHAVAVGEVR